jgi:tetratricopeptide (TPR) repeat protein
MTSTLNLDTPQDLANAIAEGRRLLESDPGAAATLAGQLVASVRGFPDAYRLLGAALRRLGRDEEASQAEMEAIMASGNDPDLIRAGEALMDGDLEGAERILRQVLQFRPDEVAAIRMLGEIAATVGLLRDAERLFRRALNLAPAFDFARLHLAATLHQQNRAAEALAELDRLGPEFRDYDEARNLRAAVLGRVGSYEEAIALYEQSLADNPEHPLRLRLSIAYLLQIVGRQDESIATYRAILAEAPSTGDAWWSLANMKTVRFADDDLATMEQALSAPGLEEEDRLPLHFALGKAYEDRGDPERAFEEYRRGNMLRAERLRHQPEQVSQLVEASGKLFTPEFLGARAASGCDAPDPIFILGMPRSGSTLVDQILASHSMIEGTAELPEIIVLARSLEPDERALGERGWQYYPQLLAELPPEELKRLGQLYIDRTRIQRKSGRPFFTDKMPNNWVHVGFIRLILPNAKIIDTRRHPLACGFSNFKQHFAKGQEFSYDLAHFGAYYRDYVRLMRHFDEVAPGAIHRVVHEELVANPEVEVRRLLDYVGVPFEESCLRFHENQRPVRTASSEQVRRPLDPSATEQWKKFEDKLTPLKEALGALLDDWQR